MSDDFKREYLGVFHPPDPLDVAADALWKAYDEQTDAFDDAVCSWRNESGVSMPANDYERNAISKNAHLCRAVVYERAAQLGVTDEHMQRAKLRRR